MKTIAIGSIFMAFALAAIIPSAFADHMKMEVSIPPGVSSAQDCEKTDECFVPSKVTVDVGSEVTWSNDDSAAHTVTSGDLNAGPDGEFDSGLFVSGKTFSHTFENEGQFAYYCMVHPWMKGTVIVQAHADSGHTDSGHEDGEGYAMTMTMDGSVNVKVGSAKPTANEGLALDVEFTDADGKAISHVNYDITAMQDGKEVLTKSGEHTHTGNANYQTSKLSSDSPVDVQIKILGIGLPDDQANWKSPKGETVSVQVVPEFGQVAMMILAVSIVSIVAVTARSKVIPRL